MRRALTTFLLSLACLAAAAHAQGVRWQSAETGDPSDIELVFENATPTGTVPPPLPPLPDGVTLNYVGPRREQSISMGPGGTVTRNLLSLIYRARARNSEPFEIPEFTVQTQGGAIKVSAFKVGAVPQAAASMARSTLAPAASSVWAGEVFPLTYILDVLRDSTVQLGATLDWNSSPLVVEEWPRPDLSDVRVNGENRTLVTYKSRAYVKTPGKFTLEPVRQEISVQTSTFGIGFLQQARLQQIAVTSSKPELTVKPLPPGAPAGFNGAVGQFKLVGTVQPLSVNVGEPITWTLALTGQGNWPEVAGLPGRDVSRNFQVVQPPGKRTMVEGKLFDGDFKEDVVLVPTRPGTYELGPVKFTYFDPKTGKYEVSECEKVTITVKGDPNAFPPEATQPATANAPDASMVAGSGGTPPPPAPPGVIPRDPLPGSSAALRPYSRPVVIGLAAIPAGPLILYWGALALARARATDPLRHRRAARNAMIAGIAELRAGGTPERRAALLRSWQSHAGVLWDFPHAAPSAGNLTISNPEWARLWAEADRVIYGPEPTLPTTWPERAETALADRPVKGFSPFRLFLPGNLVPMFALLAAIALAGGTALGAADAPKAAPKAVEPPDVAYRTGNFADAEKGWRARASAQQNDWIARHNLALALLQQDRGAEAAAHATAAFIQNPANPSVRWHLAPIFEKAAFTPEPLVGFINPNFGHRIAQLASVPQWQLILVAASALASAAAAWLLRAAYTGRYHRGGRLAAGSLLSLGLVVAAASIYGQRAYGDAGNARAVLAWKSGTLRSIPTEADDTQKTTPLPAGSIAVANEAFLGWQKYTFSNGQTGWARKTDFVPLW